MEPTVSGNFGNNCKKSSKHTLRERKRIVHIIKFYYRVRYSFEHRKTLWWVVLQSRYIYLCAMSQSLMAFHSVKKKQLFCLPGFEREQEGAIDVQSQGGGRSSQEKHGGNRKLQGERLSQKQEKSLRALTPDFCCTRVCRSAGFCRRSISVCCDSNTVSVCAAAFNKLRESVGLITRH